MLSFDYVKAYQVGDRVEIRAAEELLAGYNDFHAANLEVYQGRNKKNATENETVTTEPEPDEAATSQLEKIISEDVKAFESAWGSMDFASATLVGLDIDWDSLQSQLLAEQEKHVRPADSALNATARQLRKVASVLAFSERIVGRLRGKAVDKEMIKLIMDGFEVLLKQVHDKDIDIPELDGAENKKITKLKTVDGILDYANSLFKLGR